MFGSGLWLGVGFGHPASPGWGLGRVCLGTVCGVVPLLRARVCGVCGWAWVSACTPPFMVRVMGRAWLRERSACTPPFTVPLCGVGLRAGVLVSATPRHSLRSCWGVYVLVCPSRVVSCTPWLGVLCGGVWLVTRPATRGWGKGFVCVCACAPLVPRLSWLGCAVWACVLGSGLGCVPPFLVGLLGCVFFSGGGVSCFGFVVSVAGCPGLGSCGLCPPITSLSGCVAGSFFFRPSVVCVRAFWVSLFPVGRWSWLGVAGFGWVVPLCPFRGSCLRCLLDGGFGRLLRCWWAVWSLWAVLGPPPCFFFGGGSACASLCLPWAGARTGPNSVWSSGLPLLVAFCLAVSRLVGSGWLCTRWARRPFLQG